MIRRLMICCVVLTTTVCQVLPAGAVPTGRGLERLALRYGIGVTDLAALLPSLPPAQIKLLEQDAAQLDALSPAQIQGFLNGLTAARSDTGGSGQTVARWIQMAPGSSVDTRSCRGAGATSRPASSRPSWPAP